MGPLRLCALVAAFLLVAGACGSSTGNDVAAPAESVSQDTGSSTSTASTTTSLDEPTTTTAAPVGDLVNLVGGGQLDLNSVQGTDTVLWFWAPW